MADHTIMILKTGPAECKVWPPYLLVKGRSKDANSADRVTWINKTQGEVTLDFWNLNVFEDGSKIRGIVIPAGKSHQVTVHASPPEGRHTYSIFCEETKTRAIGNSEPELDV
jgi:hypothetical protein